MVNKILKYKRVLGDYVGFAKSDSFNAVKAVGFIGLTLGLLGCAA